MTSRTPSAHDVARLAGVSQAAVSRAFTEGASISAATREKVMRAAETLGYRPNLLARSLIMGRSGLVGVVLGNPKNPFYVAALAALSERLADIGRQLLVFTAEGGAGDVPVEDLLKYRVDALVLMATRLSSGLADRCRAEGIAVVFYNRRAASSKGSGSVTGDNRAGARAIAAHLLGAGYRRLAYLAGTPDSSTSLERGTAFAQYLAEEGAATPIRAVGDFDRDVAMAATRRLFTAPRKDRPDAIFCANDYMALAAMEVARHELGLVIGHDVGIAGFDDIELAAWPSFALTTYSQPIAAMTEEVTRLLVGDAASGRDLVVPGELLVRASTQRSS